MTRAWLPLLLFLAGCATAPSAPFDQLRGCWIERRADGVAATMRWFPQGKGWRGDQLTYFPNEDSEHRAYRLERDGPDWRLCPLDEPHGPPCRTVSSGGLDYFARVVAGPERLRMAFVDEGEELILFDGDRDGCD